MIYWAACIDSTLYLVGVFVLGVWQNHPLACALAVATKGVSYVDDMLYTVAKVDKRWLPIHQAAVVLLVVLGALAGVLAL